MNRRISFLDQLPDEVGQIIRTQLVVQYATVSAAGVPIDTPTAAFVGWNQQTLDIATGLAYPVKAERARKNPKVGLLIESDADKPVISIAGSAAVRDADLQANLDRYMAEMALLRGKTAMTDWAVAREAVWYYARIFVYITPLHVRWWPNRAAMDEPPQSWRAPADTAPPESDPGPLGQTSASPAWPERPWRELASAALQRNAPCHLTLLDSEGFPLPIGVRAAKVCDEGFRLTVPAGAPWRAGNATLSFAGLEIFAGSATTEGTEVRLRVERALPIFPLTADMSEVLRPKPDTRAALMKRLEAEARRRGQPVPSMPRDPPQPTAGALYRAGGLP